MRWRILAAATGLALLVAYMSDRYVADRGPRELNGAVTSELSADIQDSLRAQLSESTYKEAFRAHRLRQGQPFARLIIPSLHVDLIVVEGISGNALRAGAGHYPNSEYPGSAYPGDSGNVCIAGHRTGFGEPFLHLDRLRSHDEATLVGPTGRFTYRLVPPFDSHTNPWITGPSDFSVLATTRDPVLTITTSDPPHTSKNRLIARFKLVSP